MPGITGKWEMWLYLKCMFRKTEVQIFKTYLVWCEMYNVIFDCVRFSSKDVIAIFKNASFKLPTKVPYEQYAEWAPYKFQIHLKSWLHPAHVLFYIPCKLDPCEKRNEAIWNSNSGSFCLSQNGSRDVAFQVPGPWTCLSHVVPGGNPSKQRVVFVPTSGV